MAIQSMANADALLKQFYLPAVRYQLNNEIPLLAQVEKDSEHIEGKYAVLSLQTNRNWGIGARAEGGTLPTSGRQGYSEERTPMYFNYGVGGITGPLLKAGVSDAGSFARPLQQELKGVVDDLKRDVNRQCWGTSDGVLATCGVTTSSVQISLSGYGSNATIWNQLSQGMVIDIGTIAAPTLKGSAQTISSVSPATTASGTDGYIIVGSAITTTGTDFLFISGNGGNTANTSQKEVTGLQTIVASSGTLFNVNPTTVQSWVATVNSNSGTNRALSEALMSNVVNKVHIASGQDPKMAVGSVGVYRAFANLQTSLKRYTNTVDMKGGWKGLEFSAGTSPIQVTWDRDTPNNQLFFINTDHLKEFQMSDWDFMDQDGNVLLRTGTTDGYSFTLFKYMDLCTDQRNSHGLLKDITEANS